MQEQIFGLQVQLINQEVTEGNNLCVKIVLANIDTDYIHFYNLVLYLLCHLKIVSYASV